MIERKSELSTRVMDLKNAWSVARNNSESLEVAYTCMKHLAKNPVSAGEMVDLKLLVGQVQQALTHEGNHREGRSQSMGGFKGVRTDRISKDWEDIQVTTERRLESVTEVPLIKIGGVWMFPEGVLFMGVLDHGIMKFSLVFNGEQESYSPPQFPINRINKWEYEVVMSALERVGVRFQFSTQFRVWNFNMLLQDL